MQLTRQWPYRYRLNKAVLSTVWHEHLVPLFLYAVLSIALSWPLVANFTTHITGQDHEDPLHNLWLLWHTKEAVMGHQPWFDAPYLYYPQGVSLLTHGLGPVVGIFALPFWPLGPEAAHNGALLVSLCLTGYCMYLLARSLDFERSIAIFAGIMLLSAPMCLAGLFGHMTKIFLGTFPLALLTINKTLNTQHSKWWAVGVALSLLLSLLHSGYQFIFASFGVGFFALAALLTNNHAERWQILQRLGLISLCTALIVGPLLLQILLVGNAGAIAVNTSNQAIINSPDAIQFVIPSFTSLFLVPLSQPLYEKYNLNMGPEYAISLSFTGIILCFVAFRWKPSLSRIWFILTLICVILSFGPQLKLLGQDTFTGYQLPILLPYAFLTDLPGLDFMRVPGRFMMLGFVSFSVAASYGLVCLIQRWPKYKGIIITAAIVFLFIEVWPQPFPQQELPPMPEFYRQIASDEEEYGIFNLPVNPTPGLSSYITKSAIYQIYQMTHNKGISAGYISRSYDVHPLFPHLMTDYFQTDPSNIFLNNQSAQYLNIQTQLADNNYRYVVWHKAQDDDEIEGDIAAREFIDTVFDQQEPLVDDGLIRVYEVQPEKTLTTTLRIGENWRQPGTNGQWAVSPARLYVDSVHSQPALLQIVPAHIHDPQSSSGFGTTGILDISVGDSLVHSVEIKVNQATVVPIYLAQGKQTITLTLQAGNFQPSQYGGELSSTLSFAIRALNLQTIVNPDITPDFSIEGDQRNSILASYGNGWYSYESAINTRWTASPAEIYIYSPISQQAEIEINPTSIYSSNDQKPIGDNGTLKIMANGTFSLEETFQTNKPLTFDVSLQSGWNNIELELEAGNFRPADIRLTEDTRSLSFAVSSVTIRIN